MQRRVILNHLFLPYGYQNRSCLNSWLSGIHKAQQREIHLLLCNWHGCWETFPDDISLHNTFFLSEFLLWVTWIAINQCINFIPGKGSSRKLSSYLEPAHSLAKSSPSLHGWQRTLKQCTLGKIISSSLPLYQSLPENTPLVAVVTRTCSAHWLARSQETAVLRSGDLGGWTGRKEQYLLSIIAPDGSKCPQTMKQNAAETVWKRKLSPLCPLHRLRCSSFSKGKTNKLITHSCLLKNLL